MKLKCWCCRESVGQCVCQDEDTEICGGCHRCVQHCRCKQLKQAPVNENRNRARPDSLPAQLRPRIYIAGTRSADAPPSPSLREVIGVQVKLIKAGFTPYCPRLIHGLDPGSTVVPSLWLEMDLPWLRVSEAVLCLPGKSRDAELEERFAWRKGVPVFFAVEDLLKYFNQKLAE